MRKEVAVAVGQTAVTAALWGTSFPVISVALKAGLDPSMFAFLRFAVAGPLMLVATLTRRREVKALFRSRAIWIVAFLDAVGFLCQYVGQQYTPASVAALLVNLSVVLAAVGAALFLGERLGPYKVAGVVFAFAGTALIATNGDLASLAQGELLGDALYLLAALAWAAYIVYAKKETDETDWDPFAASACIVSLTAVMLAPAALLSGGRVPASSQAWEAILYTAVFNTAIPFALYQAGLKRLSASTSAVILMLEVVVAVVISVALLGETFTVFSAVGALAVMASIFLVSGVEMRGLGARPPPQAGGSANPPGTRGNQIQ